MVMVKVELEERYSFKFLKVLLKGLQILLVTIIHYWFKTHQYLQFLQFSFPFFFYDALLLPFLVFYLFGSKYFKCSIWYDFTFLQVPIFISDNTRLMAIFLIAILFVISFIGLILVDLMLLVIYLYLFKLFLPISIKLSKSGSIFLITNESAPIYP